jgi:hypothetical protein
MKNQTARKEVYNALSGEQCFLETGRRLSCPDCGHKWTFAEFCRLVNLSEAGRILGLTCPVCRERFADEDLTT